ncbi:GntR family transcriptional regulator [Alicyclobacillus ferrooxydans]|uniref:GntR family transcriptional regulator n=1 Tax=Alicyclobacillus ferrooxydans TaxID=471514 RepID=UPI0006D5AF68|nr:GntR family transcriptional regulator [Alicyclobacillus ferrooxydans]
MVEGLAGWGRGTEQSFAGDHNGSLGTIRRVHVPSLRDVAIESIRDAIVSGHLRSGQALRERALAEQLGISTTPIKEALRILVQQGLVITVPRKGNFVSTQVDSLLSEVSMIRAQLEGAAARLAALKATDEDLELLQGQLAVMKKLTRDDVPDARALFEANTAFHETVRAIARNSMITQFLQTVSDLDRAFRKRALEMNGEVLLGFKEHSGIYEAIAAKDPDVAELEMRRHIMETAGRVLNKVDTPIR